MEIGIVSPTKTALHEPILWNQHTYTLSCIRKESNILWQEVFNGLGHALARSGCQPSRQWTCAQGVQQHWNNLQKWTWSKILPSLEFHKSQLYPCKYIRQQLHGCHATWWLTLLQWFSALHIAFNCGFVEECHCYKRFFWEPPLKIFMLLFVENA